jgi:hypothetical protein
MYCVRNLPVHWAENGCNFHTQYKSIQHLQTLQASIFRILQHCNFTKHCNFTLSMLFLAEVIDLHRLVLELVYNGNCLFYVQYIC